jgi:hypothetical protein
MIVDLLTSLAVICSVYGFARCIDCLSENNYPELSHQATESHIPVVPPNHIPARQPFHTEHILPLCEPSLTNLSTGAETYLRLCAVINEPPNQFLTLLKRLPNDKLGMRSEIQRLPSIRRYLYQFMIRRGL